MKDTGGFLVVRVGQSKLGLQLSQVLAVVMVGEVHSVPVRETAVRGLVRLQGRVLPLVHLGSLLGKSSPEEPGMVGVVIALADRRVCLQVDDAELLVRQPILPVPPGEALPWAAGVARMEDCLVPILDLNAISSRLTEAA